jgi:hypothetical protein
MDGMVPLAFLTQDPELLEMAKTVIAESDHSSAN